MFGQSLLSAFGIACTTDTDQLFGTNQSATSTATYQLNASPVTSIPSNTYPGTPSNITYAAGKFGNAAVFNGSSSKIQLPDNVSVATGNNDFTISTWVYLNNIPSGNTSIITTQANYYFYILIGSSGNVRTYNNTVQVNSAAGVITTGTWYNIVATLSSTSGKNVYVNGTNVATSPDTSNCASLAGQNAQNAVGYYMSGGGYSYFLDGKIDQVRIFNTALPASAVTALYNETTTTAQSASIDYVSANPNSVAYYKMSDATDQLGNYNGTATNVNFNTEGKFGFAGAFNGLQTSAASYMDISSSTTSTTSSVSLWFNTTVKDSNYGNILDAGGGSSGNTGFAIIRMPTTGYLQVNFTDGTTGQIQSFTGSTDITDGNWHNVVLSMAADNTFVFYLDGSSHLSGTRTRFTSGDTQNKTVNRFGTNVGSVGASSYGGTIDQIRIYDSALSAANVSTLYKEIECEPAAINALENFNTVLYTGNAGAGNNVSQTVSGVGFKADLVWVKNRDNANNHVLLDSVRGTTNWLNSNNTNSQYSNAYTADASITSNGFTTGTSDQTNKNNNDFVAWNWKAPLANLSTSFNGSSSYISITGNSFNYAAMTLSCWFNLDSTSTNYQTIFNNYSQTGSENRGWYVRYETGGNIRLRGYSDGNVEVANILQSTTINAGTWYNLAITITSSQIKIYQDGGLINTTSISAAIGYSGTGGFPTIGAYRYTSANVANYFDGKIAQVRIFNDTLTASEVSDLYAEPAASNNTLNYPAGAGCIAAYPLQTDAVDLSGNYSGASSNVTFGQPGYLTGNTDGTIPSAVAANPEAGFSIVKYTGNGTAGATVGHGLTGLTPQLILIKQLDTAGHHWKSIITPLGAGKALYLNLDIAVVSGQWNNTLPTTSVFTLDNDTNDNESGQDHIAYCFTSIPGYSKIGFYSGGSTDLIFTGFTPKFLMVKKYNASGTGWYIFDAARNPSNPRDLTLFANSSAAEAVEGNAYKPSFVTDGFSWPLTTGGSGVNTPGGEYIFLAIA